ncbi:hypothetical protein B9Z55_022830 [Caenorhabditis nigoni]|uniref:BTB domain-containing protein n=1 Tax=Caenorhabditis nigoni TaxID=1611254 RepID=A0A2G5SMM2_9PELO|nr:hypothetical protein B9Z55_022830 [Caenorhabditis nigoni]
MAEMSAKRRRDDESAEQFEIKEETCKSIRESFEELKIEIQIANSNQEKAFKLLVENQEQEIQEKIEKLEKRIHDPDDTKLDAQRTFRKLFSLKSSFTDAISLEDGSTRVSKGFQEFGETWKIHIQRNQDKLGVLLEFCKNLDFDDLRQFALVYEVRVGEGYNPYNHDKSEILCYEEATHSLHELSWSDVESIYKKNGNLTIDCLIEIRKMYADNWKIFCPFDSNNQEFSDVVLNVGGQKFYVLKKYLAMHSSFFEKLFDGESKESGIWRLHYWEVDPIDFQKFLEALHGEFRAVNDSTVETLLLLNQFYRVRNLITRCHDFLKTTSKMTLVKKAVLASKYKLILLFDKCVQEITTMDEIREIMDVEKELDLSMTKSLLKRAISLS